MKSCRATNNIIESWKELSQWDKENQIWAPIAKIRVNLKAEKVMMKSSDHSNKIIMALQICLPLILNNKK